MFSNIKHRKTNRYLFGRVLHIDGDKELLDKCLSLYKDLGVSAIGVCLKEEQMYIYIEAMLSYSVENRVLSMWKTKTLNKTIGLPWWP